jgi:hypothetical protein
MARSSNVPMSESFKKLGRKNVPFFTLNNMTVCSLSTKKVRLILCLYSGHKQPVDGELIVVYVRMRLKVGRRREMKFGEG